jgi:hypothetical protein
MLSHGIPVLFVSKILGHANAGITLMIYAHATIDMQDEAAKLMDEIVIPIPIKILEPEKSLKIVLTKKAIAPDFDSKVFKMVLTTIYDVSLFENRFIY